jgi:glutathione S-transferase|tara:strand:- start:8967 stop:9869 length:903 start_codon:yes stop_codon:yes gene_type:complete
MDSAKKDVIIYGGDHSSWVQAVLLGLHLKGVEYKVTTFPPRKLFKHSGILMPAQLGSDGTWMLQSADILEQHGYGRLEREDLIALLKTLWGGFNRIDSPFQFWRQWGWVRDENDNVLIRLANFFRRPFVALMFYIILRQIPKKLSALNDGSQQRMKKIPSTADMCAAYRDWQDKLLESPGPFLDGEKPGLRDIHLFGTVQLYASIPVPMLYVLMESPDLKQLRNWISAMEDECKAYRHLYSRQYFSESGPAPSRASSFESAVFWLGTAMVLITAPLSISFAAYKLRQVRKRRLMNQPSRV